jgi:hypothetical protein
LGSDSVGWEFSWMGIRRVNHRSRGVVPPSGGRARITRVSVVEGQLRRSPRETMAGPKLRSPPQPSDTVSKVRGDQCGFRTRLERRYVEGTTNGRIEGNDDTVWATLGDELEGTSPPPLCFGWNGSKGCGGGWRWWAFRRNRPAKSRNI